jgi:hypothetical protein
VGELFLSKTNITQTGKILAHGELPGGRRWAAALHKSNVEFHGSNLDYGHPEGSAHHVWRYP